MSSLRCVSFSNLIPFNIPDGDTHRELDFLPPVAGEYPNDRRGLLRLDSGCEGKAWILRRRNFLPLSLRSHSTSQTLNSQSRIAPTGSW
jgi:hypothetical protein